MPPAGRGAALSGPGRRVARRAGTVIERALTAAVRRRLFVAVRLGVDGLLDGVDDLLRRLAALALVVAHRRLRVDELAGDGDLEVARRARVADLRHRHLAREFLLDRLREGDREPAVARRPSSSVRRKPRRRARRSAR